MAYSGHVLVFLFAILMLIVQSRQQQQEIITNEIDLQSKVKKFTNGGSHDFHTSSTNGTRWAVLVAGSNGYDNYRHQADICHAYQLLKKGGLKEENIIVFMYDDIAFDHENPRPGTLINKPNGIDVYKGVPKDYISDQVSVENFFAVIMGNKSALSGGSGKVVNSGPNDHIFIYYADHGAAGSVGMPNDDDLYANDLIDVLKKKHAANGYKSLVFYLEACESGSMFEGLLPSNLNIYAVTASNSSQSSYATYCPGEFPSPPSGYITCLGDLFSISWLEDSDIHDSVKETLKKQYEVVKRRTGFDSPSNSSVVQFGDLRLTNDSLSVYIGNNPENKNRIFTTENEKYYYYDHFTPNSRFISQRDASLLQLLHKFRRAPEGSQEKVEAKKKLDGVIYQRKKVDMTMHTITKSLFGDGNYASKVMNFVRPGQPVVDDWDRFKSIVKSYEKHCGKLSDYGKKHVSGKYVQ